MKVVVFIQTNKSGSSREAVKACDRMNYYTILITNKKMQLKQRLEYGDVHQMIYLDDLSLESLENYIKNKINPLYEILTIVSFVDGYVTLASKLRDRFTYNPTNTRAIKIMESKFLTREEFADCEFTPWYLRAIIDDDNKGLFDYPLIIKKSFSSASRNVIKVNSLDEIPEEYFNSKDVLVEEFIDGEQYLIEVFVENSIPKFILKISQDNIYTKNNCFVILGYLLDKNYKVTKEEKKIINEIIERLNIVNGEFHIELRKIKNKYKVIEMNPRITGTGMNQIIEAASGVNYVEQLMKFYLGEEFVLPTINNNVYTQFLISENEGCVDRVTGKGRALKIDGIKYVYIKPRKGNYIEKPKHMGNRLGYVIANGSDIEVAKKQAVKAANEITFHIEEEE